MAPPEQIKGGGRRRLLSRLWAKHSCQFDSQEFENQPNCLKTSPKKFFLSWHAAKSFINNLTLESFIPTSMLSINKKTMRLGVTSIASKVPDILGDTGSWRHLPRHLVRFSHAFPLDSFSRAAWTRSHVRCWQLSSLGKNLECRYLQVMLIDNIRFTIPTP